MEPDEVKISVGPGKPRVVSRKKYHLVQRDCGQIIPPSCATARVIMSLMFAFEVVTA